MTYEKSIFIISYECSDGIKVSLSFKIFLQTFTDQNVPLPLFIDFFCPGHVGENGYLHPKLTNDLKLVGSVHFMLYAK